MKNLKQVVTNRKFIFFRINSNRIDHKPMNDTFFLLFTYDSKSNRLSTWSSTTFYKFYILCVQDDVGKLMKISM